MLLDISYIAARDKNLKVETLYEIIGMVNLDYSVEASVPEAAVDSGFNVTSGARRNPKPLVMTLVASDETRPKTTKVTTFFDPEYFDAVEEDLTIFEPGSTRRILAILESLVAKPIDLIASDGTVFKEYVITSLSCSFDNKNGTIFTVSVREIIFASIETTKLTRISKKKKSASNSGSFNMVEDTPGAEEILQDDDDLANDLLQSFEMPFGLRSVGL